MEDHVLQTTTVNLIWRDHLLWTTTSFRLPRWLDMGDHLMDDHLLHTAMVNLTWETTSCGRPWFTWHWWPPLVDDHLLQTTMVNLTLETTSYGRPPFVDDHGKLDKRGHLLWTSTSCRLPRWLDMGDHVLQTTMVNLTWETTSYGRPPLADYHG